MVRVLARIRCEAAEVRFGLLTLKHCDVPFICTFAMFTTPDFVPSPLGFRFTNCSRWT